MSESKKSFRSSDFCSLGRYPIIFLTVIALLLLFSATACGDDTTSPLNNDNKSDMTIYPQDFGNNIYYFNAHSSTFGTSLSEFLDENPNLEVTSVASRNLGSYGVTSGYWVIFREKE